MATIGGFTEFAQLRLRDHRPGNGEYELPPGFGPKSDSSKRSILGKYPSPSPATGVVGPGEYPIPGYIGTGRATHIGPPSRGSQTTPSHSAPPGGTRQEISEPKQYSMALYPDTPAYSMYGKLKGQWEASPTGEVGPGEYVIPSTFEAPKRGVQPGAHFGIRSTTSEEREQAGVPGPGQYSIPGLADEITKKKSYTPIPHRHHKKTEPTPGPGAYDSDPNSIAARTTPSGPRFTNVSTFGGRFRPRQYHTASPGPGAYSVDRAADILERHRRHAPTMKPPTAPSAVNPTHTKRTGRRMSSEPVTHLPSDFDYDFHKGYSMLGRWKSSEPNTSNVGPGSYDTTKSLDRDKGVVFAPKPFDPYSASRERAAQEEKEQLQYEGPSDYVPRDINYSQTEKHARGAVMGGSYNPRATVDNGVPGPGHYNPDYTVREKSGNGTVFYKGDFILRNKQNETVGGGPGAHYNDYTPYSQSISGDKEANKGYTFGIRYPARATHQVVLGRDASTNINCVYPDELTYQTQVKLPPVKRQ